MLTNNELQAIRARCEAATTGIWETDYKKRYVFTLPCAGQKMVAEMRISGGEISADEMAANANFIAHARADIPAMLDHIEAQRNALAKAESHKAVLVEALEKCVPVLEAASEFFDGVSEALDKTRAVLASVKGDA